MTPNLNHGRRCYLCAEVDKRVALPDAGPDALPVIPGVPFVCETCRRTRMDEVRM